ncbi:hypothetical protein BJZ21_002481 [Nocardioides panaciterrulae]|uniref:Uncharacterized protein n=1 Tax=Nocardioides panaciterrulae TaxID=661492 RepID=A0A7Y9JBH7_9ACTN|nr:hypothetical protein [Nocardioides panaciterrulae]
MVMSRLLSVMGTAARLEAQRPGAAMVTTGRLLAQRN